MTARLGDKERGAGEDEQGAGEEPEKEIQVLISDEHPYFALAKSRVISLLISIPALLPFTLPDRHPHPPRHLTVTWLTPN